MKFIQFLPLLAKEIDIALQSVKFFVHPCNFFLIVYLLFLSLADAVNRSTWNTWSTCDHITYQRPLRLYKFFYSQRNLHKNCLFDWLLHVNCLYLGLSEGSLFIFEVRKQMFDLSYDFFIVFEKNVEFGQFMDCYLFLISISSYI